MSTSGSTSFNPVRDQIINRALRLVGAYASTDSPRPEQSRDASETLNMMLKSWQIDGYLWLKETTVLQLFSGQVQYDLGVGTPEMYSQGSVPPTKSNVLTYTYFSGNWYVTLPLSLDIASFTNSKVWFVNGSGDLAFSTNCSYNAVTGELVALATFAVNPLIDSSWTVFLLATGTVSYTSRPTRVFTAMRKNVISGYEVPMTLIARDDYFRLPNKQSRGVPVQLYYDPQLVLGQISVWPAPSSGDDVLVLNVDRTIQDMLSDLNTFDLPQEWSEAISTNLAAKIAPEYGIPLGERQLLNQDAAQLKANIESYSRDNASTFFGVTTYGN